jgi:hypothetical protein
MDRLYIRVALCHQRGGGAQWGEGRRWQAAGAEGIRVQMGAGQQRPVAEAGTVQEEDRGRKGTAAAAAASGAQGQGVEGKAHREKRKGIPPVEQRQRPRTGDCGVVEAEQRKRASRAAGHGRRRSRGGSGAWNDLQQEVARVARKQR